MLLSDIALLRLAQQRIAQTEFRNPSEVVHWLGAVQSQDAASSAWSIGLRLPNPRQETIDKAINERSIVRTWALRGTLHTLSAADIGWLISLIAPKPLQAAKAMHKTKGLDDSTFSKAQTILEKTLQDGKELSRKEIFEALETAGITTDNSRGYLILGRFALEGLICLGTAQDKQDTYTLLSEWIPNAKSLSREEALAALALRYFKSHGPASIYDFAWWAALTISDAKRGLEAIKSQLQEASCEGQTYWMAEELADISATKELYLLSGFDEYLLGYKDRNAMIDPAIFKRIGRNNANFSYTIVSAGEIIGTWKRLIKKEGVLIERELFRPLTSAEAEAYAHAAQHYADFLGLNLLIEA